MLSPFGLFADKDFLIIWFSNLFNLIVPYEGYSTKVLCTLN